MEGMPIFRNRPALIASKKSAPPCSAASALLPDPIAAPIKKSDFNRNLPIFQLLTVNYLKVHFEGITILGKSYFKEYRAEPIAGCVKAINIALNFLLRKYFLYSMLL